MSSLGVLCLMIWALLIGLYIGEASGIKEASSDADLLRFKLSQCNEIIRGGK